MVIYDKCSICGSTTMCVSTVLGENDEEISICHNCVSDMSESLRDVDISEIITKEDDEEDDE